AWGSPRAATIASCASRARSPTLPPSRPLPPSTAPRPSSIAASTVAGAHERLVAARRTPPAEARWRSVCFHRCCARDDVREPDGKFQGLLPTAGGQPDRRRPGYQGGVPASRQAPPPGRRLGQALGAPLSGHPRGVRGVVRSGTAPALRSCLSRPENGFPTQGSRSPACQTRRASRDRLAPLRPRDRPVRPQARARRGRQPTLDGRAQRASPEQPMNHLDANLIIANAPDPVFVSDFQGMILLANEAVSELLGFRKDEVLEQSLSRFVSLDEARELMVALREVVEHGVSRNVRLNPHSASGEVIPTTLNASARRGPRGEVIGVIGILRDMRELDKARAYAQRVTQPTPDPVFVSDLQGKILQANDAVYTLLGFRTAEVVEQSLSRFISVDEAREFTAVLREVVARGVTRNARLNPRSASGEVIPTTLNASALRDADGAVNGAIGILRDMR